MHQISAFLHKRTQKHFLIKYIITKINNKELTSGIFIIGFEKRSRVLIKNQSCQSGFTCISDDINDLQFSQVMNERKEQEDADFQFALKLQKEFDLASKKAAEVDRKKGTVDAYLLRNADQVETSSDCSADQLNV